MRLTKLGHACVRLEKDGATLVIDPGGLTDPAAMDGADAILITHEHFDHLEAGRISAALADNPALHIWTNAAVASLLNAPAGRVTVVGAGDAFNAVGFSIGVHGEEHAVIHPAIPPVANIGFVVDQEVFHPGDAFTVPDHPVATLLLPSNAPWMKVTELFDYAAAMSPERAYAIHDGLLNEFGLMLVDGVFGNLGKQTGKDYRRLKPGESVEI